MLVNSIMSTPVTVVTPATSVRAAAALMGELDIGMLPVCVDGHLAGVITDRDIATRWVPNVVASSAIETIMTTTVVTCRADQSVTEIAWLMADRQLRRIVVINDVRKVVGIVSLGDIAKDVSEEIAGQTLGEIVEFR